MIRLLTTKTYVSSIAQGFFGSYIKGLVNYLYQYKHHIFLMKLHTRPKHDFYGILRFVGVVNDGTFTLNIEYATIYGT